MAVASAMSNSRGSHGWRWAAGSVALVSLALLAARGASAVLWIAALAAILEAGFIEFCARRRWYPDAPRGAGIELQFDKARVPTAYSVAILFALFLATRSIVPPVAAASCAASNLR